MSKRRLLSGAVASLGVLALVVGCAGEPDSSGTDATTPSAVDSGDTESTTLATPFPAREEPTILETMSVDEAIAFVENASRPQTDWFGPTEGPVADTGDNLIVYVSSDQSYVSYVNWGAGIEQAAEVLGWEVTTLDGKGTVSDSLQAMQQAVAMNPTAIITSADASGLQQAMEQAVSQGIPVIGIHATAFPGPGPELLLFDNITSDPAEIGLAEAAYVIAESNGTARLIHTLDTQYAIARFKAQATETPVRNLASATFLEEINIPVAEQSTRIPTVVSGILAEYGTDNLWITTCCDNFYPAFASALRSSDVTPDQVKLVGADGPPATYDMIRTGEYQVATVPEPSTLFGFMAVDSIVRAMAGEEPADFTQPVYLVTADNVDAEGGTDNQYIPSNGFACHYQNTWLGEDNDCSVTD